MHPKRDTHHICLASGTGADERADCNTGDRADCTLVGYFETPNLQAALDGMAATEVNARWQGEMKKYFVELDGRQPDEGFVQLERVMYLQ